MVLFLSQVFDSLFISAEKYSHLTLGSIFFFFFLGYVEERPLRPVQTPKNGRKKKVKG